MVEILLGVLSPFISTVTEDFLARRRDAVPLSELEDQVIRLAAGQRHMEDELVQIRQAVVVLTRFLAEYGAETFSYRGERLELAGGLDERRQVVVGQVIESFEQEVTAQVQARRQRSRRRPEPREIPAGPTSDQLKGFLDGFEEEIRRARLGQEDVV
ncbi:hypothetical protein ACRYCC_11030 [Actinomadura scrupuli]|uniref:hypothetical protein n=1 Tax=Actinomadura scrupuli TaxID=559629 RepID=UPI003D96CA8E